jgi:5,6-dimethylbenzimidazole synthase
MENDGNELNGAFSEAEREALYKLMRSRRDIRQFLPHSIPDAVLRCILEMAHLAPSVGFMQPWNLGVFAVCRRNNGG